MKKKILKSLKQTIMWLWINLPIIVGILLLISIIKYFVPMDFLSNIDNQFLGWFVSAIFGSISAGNPINSYIIAWEFGWISANIIVISAFLISWVTVWLIQIPAESYFFGKKYAILRNILAFIFSLIWAYSIYLLYIIF